MGIKGLTDGRERRCHSNQMRYRWANTEEPIQEKTDVDCNISSTRIIEYTNS